MPIVYLPKRKTLRERRTIADVVYAAMREQRLTVAAKLAEGDTIAMQGEVTMVHDDGSVTVRPRGYDVPIRTTEVRATHLTLGSMHATLTRCSALWTGYATFGAAV